MAHCKGFGRNRLELIEIFSRYGVVVDKYKYLRYDRRFLLRTEPKNSYTKVTAIANCTLSHCE